MRRYVRCQLVRVCEPCYCVVKRAWRAVVPREAVLRTLSGTVLYLKVSGRGQKGVDATTFGINQGLRPAVLGQENDFAENYRRNIAYFRGRIMVSREIHSRDRRTCAEFECLVGDKLEYLFLSWAVAKD